MVGKGKWTKAARAAKKGKALATEDNAPPTKCPHLLGAPVAPTMMQTYAAPIVPTIPFLTAPSTLQRNVPPPPSPP